MTSRWRSSSRALLCLLPCLGLMSILPELGAQTLSDPSRATTSASTVSVPQVLDSNIKPLAELEEETPYAPTTPGDDDIGMQLILKKQEKARPFSVWTDASLFWTDNAANVDTGKLEDWFFSGGVNLSAQFRVHSRFFADAYLGQHWYEYDKLDPLNYQLGDVRLGGLVIMPELANAILHVHYQYQRITDQLEDDPIYQSHSVLIGAQKTFLIDRLNSFNIYALANFSFDTEPSVLERHEYAFQAAYNFKITRSLTFSLAGRITYYDYFNFESSRSDWFQTYGASLSWRPKEYFEMGIHYNYSINTSSIDAFDYETQLTGPSILLRIRF